MLEQVAKTLAELDGNKERWQSYLPDARAAMSAMRDPTPQVLEAAGTIRYWEGTGFEHEADAAHIEWWRTMIDASLQTSVSSQNPSDNQRTAGKGRDHG